MLPPEKSGRALFWAEAVTVQSVAIPAAQTIRVIPGELWRRKGIHLHGVCRAKGVFCGADAPQMGSLPAALSRAAPGMTRK
jgi:hypothetical protein